MVVLFKVRFQQSKHLKKRNVMRF